MIAFIGLFADKSILFYSHGCLIANLIVGHNHYWMQSGTCYDRYDRKINRKKTKDRSTL